MAELALLADIQQMVYPEDVTCQLHVMAVVVVVVVVVVGIFKFAR